MKLDELSPFAIQLHQNGSASIVVAGCDLSNITERIEITMTPNNVAKIVLHCISLNAQITGEAAVRTEPVDLSNQDER